MLKLNKFKEAVFSIGLALITASLLFSHSWKTGFKESLLNLIDGRLLVGITEHWFSFYKGEVPWRDLLFFYPVKGSLGFSDALFLYSLPYSLFRATGIDPYLSWDLMLLCFAVTGYVSMYFLLRRQLIVSAVGSHLGAVFFILGAPFWTILSNSHHQLFSVWILPLQLILLCKAIDLTNGIRVKSVKWAMLSCGLYGGIAYTSFYVCWFFTFVLAIFFTTWVLSSGQMHRATSQVLDLCRRKVRPYIDRKAVLKWATVPLTLCLALLPFLLTYIPVTTRSDLVQYGSYIGTQPGLSELITPGVHNLVYGQSFVEGGFTEKPIFWELSYGFTFGFLVFCIIGIILYFSGNTVNLDNRFRIKALQLLFCSIVIAILLVVKVQDFSCWEFVRHIVPGATTIRAVFRINVVLYPALLIAAVFAWDRIWSLSRKRVLVKLLVGLCIVGILVEQFGMSHLDLRVNRIKELQGITKIPDPSQEIEAFFLTADSEQLAGISGVTALHIAQVLKIPTIQGYSGVFPKESAMHNYDTGTSEYFTAVRKWIRCNDIAGPVGELDPNTMTWKIHPAGSLMMPDAFCEFGKSIFEQEQLDSQDYLLKGWSGVESWGVWSDSTDSVMCLPVASVPENGLYLNLVIHAYIPNTTHTVSSTVSINDVRTIDFHFGQQHPKTKLSILIEPNQVINGMLLIRFQTKGNISPLEAGSSKDGRTLGIGISYCSLDRVLAN